MKFKVVSDAIDFGSCSLNVLLCEERKGEPRKWELPSSSLLDSVSSLPALPPQHPTFS